GGMDAMMQTMELSGGNIVDITHDVRLLLTRLNAGEGTLGAMLNDPEMVTDVRTMLHNLTITSQNSVKATNSLIALTDQLNKEGTLVHDLVTDTVIFNSLKTTVAQLN